MNMATAKLMGLTILLIAFPAFSQCPAGFVDLGEISATAAPGKYQEVQVKKEIVVPDGMKIDDAFHQKSIQAASDGGASNLSASQIPAGFFLIPGGQGGGAWWSIDSPELKQVPLNVAGKSARVFRINLYANTGGRGQSVTSQDRSQISSLGVWVRVCAKTQTNA
jgi:hypothetical protein